MTLQETADTDIPAAIESLERAVFQGRTQEGIERLLRLLYVLNANRGPLGVLAAPATDAQRLAVYTRVAAMISALACSPAFQLTLPQVTNLCSRKPILEAIFELSGFEGPGHLLRYHAAKNPDGSMTLTGNQVFMLSLFYSLDTLPEELMEGVLQLHPAQLLPLMLGWFTAPFVHSHLGEAHRKRLIAASSRIRDVMPAPEVLQAITTAWMFCSYADDTNKHELKRNLNAVWRRVGENTGLRERQTPRRLVERPTLLVLAERLTIGHAMHRSYGDCLRQLRQKFKLVCIVVKQYASEENHSLFDEILVIDQVSTFPELGAKIVRIAPDIIYFPSLGMSEWTQLVANFRFAPIQMMTLGHPAPAMTPTIDYSLVQSGHGVAAGEYGQKVIERKSWGHFVPHSALAGYDSPVSPYEDGLTHIAVNSSMMKLSPRFLALLERLEEESAKPLHFHFFASMMGVGYDRMQQVLRRRFKHVTLEPTRSYGDFLKALAPCHLALAAFPFGNTNSTVDTCLLGIPTVAYYANEVLSIGDRDVMRLVDLPSWLVSDNDEDYFQVAMKLIHNDEARQAIVEQLKATDVRAKVFEPPRPEDASEFVEAVDWIYRNHEALQASSRHLLKVGDPIPA
ncbi:MAG: hypothetical protein ACK5W4_08275 [Inhella sp.]|jgi:hypothetical protein|uniref:hypothetical protein n=1 Tax=Inhella sp. TaxID=1921806 RepID=UPI00391F07B7